MSVFTRLQSTTASGIAPTPQHARDEQGGRSRPSSAPDGRKGSNDSVTWQDHHHPANQSQGDGLASKINSVLGSPGPSQGGSKQQSLQSAKSVGNLASKPSWTKLQQDNLRNKKARTHHQSQGFNGLVQ